MFKYAAVKLSPGCLTNQSGFAMANRWYSRRVSRKMAARPVCEDWGNSIYLLLVTAAKLWRLIHYHFILILTSVELFPKTEIYNIGNTAPIISPCSQWLARCHVLAPLVSSVAQFCQYQSSVKTASEMTWNVWWRIVKLYLSRITQSQTKVRLFGLISRDVKSSKWFRPRGQKLRPRPRPSPRWCGLDLMHLWPR